MQKKQNPFGKNILPALKNYHDTIKQMSCGLDIGCAYGANSRYLGTIGLKIDAIDKSLPEDIELHPNVILQETDVLNFNFEKMYDIILAINILQFLSSPDRNKIMDKMYESLNMGGLLFINSFISTDEDIKMGKIYFKKKELLEWAQNKKLNIKSYDEKVISDDHPPHGKHMHYIVSLVAKKIG